MKMFGCPSLFSKTPLSTFMKLYIMIVYVLVRKPIEFGGNWSMLIKLIMKNAIFSNSVILSSIFYIK